MTDLINWFLGLLSADQWEMWRNWIATTVGVGVAGVALRTYVANARVRKFEQARLVSAKLFSTDTYKAGDSITHRAREEPGLSIEKGLMAEMNELAEKAAKYTFESPVLKLGIVVRNTSKERIGPVIVRPYNRSAGAEIESTHTFDTVDPESEERALVVIANPFPQGMPVLGLAMRFQDATGRWWRRNLTEPVRRSRPIKQVTVRDHYWVELETQEAVPSFRAMQYRALTPVKPSWLRHLTAGLRRGKPHDHR